jgi:hypothetical protein
MRYRGPQIQEEFQGAAKITAKYSEILDPTALSLTTIGTEGSKT